MTRKYEFTVEEKLAIAVEALEMILESSEHNLAVIAQAQYALGKIK